MNKTYRFLSIFAALVIFASLVAYFDYMAPVNFKAKGKVIEAKWDTSNHKMSLFKIQEDNGATKELHHYRVSLQPGQIKVGDAFEKEEKSANCKINNVVVQCII